MKIKVKHPGNSGKIEKEMVKIPGMVDPKEKNQLDLGCGDSPRIEEGYVGYGVDIHSKLPNIKEADLAVEPIPYPDNAFDLVTAFDFLEHIPPMLYIDGKKRNCMIEMFNEIYRVLKDGGEFYMQTPCYPSRACWQDPTHLYVWTEETVNYFSGDYYGMHDRYQYTSRFEKVSQTFNGSHVHMRLKAVKIFPDDYPYLINYYLDSKPE